MSGLKITNEITNLDGPGPPEVQTDFEPQGDTVLLATGSAAAHARTEIVRTLCSKTKYKVQNLSSTTR